MKKIFIVIFLLFSIYTEGFSQKSLNDYSYVVVPDQFEFLNEKDKYQLNSITKFLFNKHGFHAFFMSEVPDAKRCDGLYADLDRGNSFLKTKFSIVLRDCDGLEIYRSPEGVSKFKEFKKAYQDAVRKAFKGIEALGVQQKEIVYFNSEATSEESVKIAPVKKEVIETAEIPITVEKESRVNAEVLQKSNLPQTKFSSYSFKGKSFLLRKTPEGYSLYEESTTTSDGLLLLGKIEIQNASKVFFTDTSENIYKASFDASQNLTIQKQESSEVYTIVR
ncbi:hypothetical protein ATE92_1613 [Ulvibacter sp. MAR_2010_11]|uniref:hypothetical protein n=1 Tax=Ulvibacter sp. MAR_2010_11 TaxID=1250229 RepID=UPI000C2BCA7B|nr:hypothetical protein [Ulvibacter sp. MAR_2010_11]PKA83458.1 hypothetical protein ATE92_1613 [Ulvibacter sp. MAR_2010_11]